MDCTQKHYSVEGAIKTGWVVDVNDDPILQIPNFTLMERFFVIGGKDPWLFHNKILDIEYPPNTKDPLIKCETLKR